jgi:cytochrome c-type biogenesis protein CcmH
MRSLAVVAFLLLLGGAAPAWASGQDVANQVSQRVMSPYCEGVTLHDCPSQKAAELRGRIARWARNGMTEEEIIHRLTAQFGASVKAEPDKTGSGLIAWLVPLLAVAAAAAVAAVWVRRLAGSSPGAEAGRRPVLSDSDRARVRRELERFGERR